MNKKAACAGITHSSIPPHRNRPRPMGVLARLLPPNTRSTASLSTVWVCVHLLRPYNSRPSPPVSSVKQPPTSSVVSLSFVVHPRPHHPHFARTPSAYTGESGGVGQWVGWRMSTSWLGWRKGCGFGGGTDTGHVGCHKQEALVVV